MTLTLTGTVTALALGADGRTVVTLNLTTGEVLVLSVPPGTRPPALGAAATVAVATP